MIKNLKRKSEAGYQMIDYYKDWKQVIYLTSIVFTLLSATYSVYPCKEIKTFNSLTVIYP